MRWLHPPRWCVPSGSRWGSLRRARKCAVYGGFGVAIAGVLVFAAIRQGDIRAGIVITVGAALAGMAFGRLVSAVVGDRPAFYPNWFYCSSRPSRRLHYLRFRRND
jgi:hypothetical protein